MKGLRSCLDRYRFAAAFLCAAALMLRALVPAGYMIAPASGAGQFFVTVCTGLEGKVMRVALPLNGKQDAPQQGHDGKDGPCAFTALAGLADTPPLPGVLQPFQSLTAPLPGKHVVMIGRGLAAPPPPQTGPPAIA